MINETNLPGSVIDVILRGYNLRQDRVEKVYKNYNGNIVVVRKNSKIPIVIPYIGGFSKVEEEIEKKPIEISELLVGIDLDETLSQMPELQDAIEILKENVINKEENSESS